MLAQIFLSQYPPHDQYPARSFLDQYKQWDKAYLARNVNQIDDLVSMRFKIITESGTEISRTTYLVSFGEASAPESYKTQLLRVKTGNQKTLTWTRETSEDEIHYYLDTWVKERGRWRLLNSKTLREEGH